MGMLFKEWITQIVKCACNKLVKIIIKSLFPLTVAYILHYGLQLGGGMDLS